MTWFISATLCTLSMTLPSADMGHAKGACVGDSLQPTMLNELFVYGQEQWGERDLLVHRRSVVGQAGQRISFVFMLPSSKLWVLRVKTTNAAGQMSCESNPVVANVSGFIYPPWRPW